jgi:hypothetical protein
MMRDGHGTGKGQPRIEVLEPRKLPRTEPGKVVRGGATGVKMARSLSLQMGDAEWAPYLAQAEKFRKHQTRSLARQAGGFCGAAPASMIASAALQLAMSRFMFDRGSREGDMSMIKMASTIANDSRQNLLAAYELAIREAQARAKYEESNPHRALVEALVSEPEKPRSPHTKTVW